MRRIVPESLWLGTLGDVFGMEAVLREGISALVDLALDEFPTRLPRDMVYCRFPVVDGPGNPPGILGAAIGVTVALLDAKIPTLVYCGAGMSRSPAIAAAAIAVLRGRSAEETLAGVCRNRAADVSPGLWSDVKAVISARR